MKRFWALLLMLVLVLSFQNCEPTAYEGRGRYPSGVQVGFSDNSTADFAQIAHFEILNVEAPSQVSSKPSESFGSHRLLVSLEDGEIQLLDEGNQILATRCLSSSQLNEAKMILDDSKICETKVESDLICGMRFKYAYASLISEEQRVALGEEQDTCGRGKKDLCGGMASVFQAYVSHIKANWSEMSCE